MNKPYKKMLNKKSKTQKITNYMIPISRKKKSRERIEQGMNQEYEQGLTANETEGSYCVV